ncbi:ABC transporter permease [Cohnella abietis]|uniref:ABC transporter permease n=1 Tax=Cohnella abietis TaxID=2507935 RepID=UPI0018D5244E|nr:ABC transporter permease [Cohnella abietis]
MKKKHAYLFIGAFIIIFFVLLALFAPWFTRFDPLALAVKERLQAPSAKHLLGTDALGRDVFSRICYGARASMFIGLAVVFLTTVLGGTLGLVIGFYRIADSIISRILDGLMAFPEIILAVTLAALWGAGIKNIIYVLTFAYIPSMARVVRASVISVKSLEYIESGRAAGARNIYLIFRYILPACRSAIIVQATFCFAAAILAEASLSFLGVGIKEPTPSLGGMISEGRDYLGVASWLSVAPGTVIVLVVLGLNLLGDGLRDHLDPKLKTR